MKTTAHVFVLILVGMHVSALFAAELPDADIKAYLEQQRMPQLQAKPGARMQRDVEARWLKWFERTVTTPFATRLKTDVPIHERAVRLVQKGIMQLRQSAQRDPTFTSSAMAAECAALVKAGVDDPLIHWLQGWASYDSTQDFPGCEAAFKRGVQHPRFKELSAALRLLMLSSYADTARAANRTTSKLMPRGEDIIEAAWRSLQERAYQPDEDEILDENLWPLFREEVLPKNEPRVQEICGLPALSEWARLMLTGRYHERKAWLARGHQFANSVKPEGWQGFEACRIQAVECFLKAWKLRKDTPVAARELLGIGLTGGDTGEQPFVWLQYVQDAQFDHASSFRSLMNGLLPRWGGSHKKMLAFGLSCAATKRFDTEVPYFFFQALRDVARDVDDWQPVCRDPLISQVAIALCKQRVQDAPTPEQKQEALTLLGAYGWICGDYVAADEALVLAKAKFSRAVITQLLPFRGFNEQVIRAESAIFAVGYEEHWRAAESAMAAKDLTAAEDGYQTIRAQLNGVAGAELADSRLATVKFERSLASGDWVPLRVDPTLAGWQIQKGDWTGTVDGHLTNRGRGTSAFIYHLGRVGTEFQIRGEFIAGKSGFGVLIGRGYDEDQREQWLTCVMKRGQAYFLDRYYSCALEKRKMTGPPSPATFLITCHDGKITFEANGQEVFTEVVPLGYNEPHMPLRLMPDGHVGFCLPLFDKDNLTTILRSEVRRLPADFKLKP